jgi:hypothetical protein
MRLFPRQCIAFYCFGNADITTGLSTPINSNSISSSSAAAKAANILKERHYAPYRYLSDLPTPSLVLDLMAIEKIIRGSGPSFTDDANSIPPFRIRDWILHPKSCNNSDRQQEHHDDDDDDDEVTTRSTATTTGTNTRLPESLDELTTARHGADTKGLDVCFGYIHATVLEPRHREGRYLAKLDLVPTGTSTTTTVVDAHLVLGLNNHHVGSYYWARSAGGGAAMEAPGIALRGGNRLEWESSSFKDCNSNDGKRSEWVNFLNVGDQVQLRPHDLAASIRHFRDHVYGISSAGRPLGAEPMVLCRFDVEHVSTSEP